MAGGAYAHDDPGEVEGQPHGQDVPVQVVPVQVVVHAAQTGDAPRRAPNALQRVRLLLLRCGVVLCVPLFFVLFVLGAGLFAASVIVVALLDLVVVPVSYVSTGRVRSLEVVWVADTVQPALARAEEAALPFFVGLLEA
jgi:hypothetical protein